MVLLYLALVTESHLHCNTQHSYDTDMYFGDAFIICNVCSLLYGDSRKL